MALSTIKTMLLVGTTASLTVSDKICAIKDYPDLMGVPEALETTTLDDSQQTFIEGVRSGEQLTFTANYDETVFTTIQGYAGSEKYCALWFGESGADGKFSFQGYVNVSLVGKGVNEVREMTITITPTTGITFSAN